MRDTSPRDPTPPRVAARVSAYGQPEPLRLTGPLVCSRTGSRRRLGRELRVDFGPEDVEFDARVGHDLGGQAVAFA